MDTSEDNFDPQQQQQQQQQEQQLGQQLQQSEQLHSMQYDEINPTEANNPFNDISMSRGIQLPTQYAIPLPPPPSSNNFHPPDMDIDAMLLQQFSCLGTTDHDDLIAQFITIMNHQMNREAAHFFLEMSNWNLQAAVGSYLDYFNFQTIPSMKILETYRPTEFQQAWRLQNDGTEDWPKGCYLMSPSQTKRIELQKAIKPGDTCDILADVPPSQPAITWRLCTPNGWYFGESISMIPPGVCDLNALMVDPRGGINPECFPQVNVVISVNMD